MNATPQVGSQPSLVEFFEHWCPAYSWILNITTGDECYLCAHSETEQLKIFFCKHCRGICVCTTPKCDSLEHPEGSLHNGSVTYRVVEFWNNNFLHSLYRRNRNEKLRHNNISQNLFKIIWKRNIKFSGNHNFSHSSYRRDRNEIPAKPPTVFFDFEPQFELETVMKSSPSHLP